MSKANFMTIDPVVLKAFTKWRTVTSFYQPHGGTRGEQAFKDLCTKFRGHPFDVC